jgi:SdrD B-like domain
MFQPVFNTVFVEGKAPDGSVVTDQDDAAVTEVGAGGTAAIGDLVWQGTNRDQIQDAGEVGIPNARVHLEVDPDSGSGISLTAPVGVDLVTDPPVTTSRPI